jgi:hypothetical protein
MSAIGAACAAIWLRYRAPVKDRVALGLLGSPPVAVVVAAALVIIGAVGETFLPAGAWLAWLVALDLIALVLLRRTIHVGLLEEAAEADIGPEVRCVNCGAGTASHTFCSNCGISLKALPKSRDPAAAPPTPKPRCKPGIPCGAPPIVAHVMTLPGYAAWQSTGLSFSLRFPTREWSVARQGTNNVALQSGDGNGVLVVTGTRASHFSPSAAINAQLGSLQGQLLGLARDTNPSDQLLGTNVGLVPGPGSVYTGTIASAQGPETPVALAIVAAAQRGITVVATAIAPADDPNAKAGVYQQADHIINSIRWG